jgi:hypothetical protein
MFVLLMRRVVEPTRQLVRVTSIAPVHVVQDLLAHYVRILTPGMAAKPRKEPAIEAEPRAADAGGSTTEAEPRANVTDAESPPPTLDVHFFDGSDAALNERAAASGSPEGDAAAAAGAEADALAAPAPLPSPDVVLQSSGPMGLGRDTPPAAPE